MQPTTGRRIRSVFAREVNGEGVLLLVVVVVVEVEGEEEGAVVMEVVRHACRAARTRGLVRMAWDWDGVASVCEICEHVCCL